MILLLKCLIYLFTFEVWSAGKSEQSNETSVIIIGAGAAGLAAAGRLCQMGVDPAQITILEAENRIGGRVKTVPFGPGIIELGAQWVHGENNEVYRLASNAGLLHTEFQTLESSGGAEDLDFYYPENGRKVTQKQRDQYHTVKKRMFQRAKSDLLDSKVSLGTYMNQTFSEYVNDRSLDSMDPSTAWDLLNWEQRGQALDIGTTNWFEVSGWPMATNDFEGDELVTWKNGYSTLLPLLIKSCPQIIDRIRLNTVVSQIDWNSNDSVRITTTEGQVYKTRVALATVSLGVLKEKADAMFMPRLPESKRRAIQGLGYGSVAKIFLKFEAPWWDREKWNGVNFVTTSASRQVPDWTSNLLGFYTMRDQPNLLMGWLSGDGAIQMEGYNETHLLSECSRLLKGAIGKDFPNYAEPVALIRTIWKSNPHFLGTYSYRSVASDELNVWPRDLAEPLKNSEDEYRLFFAGEATSQKRYSTVHGAVETGQEQAEKIAKIIL